MSPTTEGYSVLLPDQAFWRESNIMKIPNTNLADQLGTEKLGACLWRMPPFSANTWHRHVDQDELYFVLEGTGRIRLGSEILTIPKYGAVLVTPKVLRQVFNDTSEEVLWLIVGAPRYEGVSVTLDASDLRSLSYPEDLQQLPVELHGRTWPPER